jgi:hypothetical protein
MNDIRAVKLDVYLLASQLLCMCTTKAYHLITACMD